MHFSAGMDLLTVAGMSLFQVVGMAVAVDMTVVGKGQVGIIATSSCFVQDFIVCTHKTLAVVQFPISSFHSSESPTAVADKDLAFFPAVMKIFLATCSTYLDQEDVAGS